VSFYFAKGKGKGESIVFAAWKRQKTIRVLIIGEIAEEEI
jgi:hypothetical protein